MALQDELVKRNISKYRLSQMAGVPYMTINDLCNGKSSIEKCNALTIYQIAKALRVTMEELIESSLAPRPSFEIFKSNVCHRLKALGDINFLLETLSGPDIRNYQKRKWYPECLYLLAMVDYLSRIHHIPLCKDFEDLRAMRLSEVIYPSSVLSLAIAGHDEEQKRQALEESIPEFRRFNIVESEIRNVI